MKNNSKKNKILIFITITIVINLIPLLNLQFNYTDQSSNTNSLIKNEDVTNPLPILSGPEINISSPVSGTITTPSKGYYPATYSFESDDIGSIHPEGWTCTSTGKCKAVVESEVAGHKNVIKLADLDGGKVNITDYFSSTNIGRIEFWFLAETGCGETTFILKNALDRVAFYFTIDSGYVRVKYDGGVITSIPIVDSKWYHTDMYFTTDNDLFSVWLDGNIIINFQDFYQSVGGGIVKMEISTNDAESNYNCYLDAIGYSWDSQYTYGDNQEEGLYLSYDAITDFTWQGYSLDGQANITINGNTVLEMPNDGPHTIQVHGIDSSGNFYASDVTAFTIDTVMGINTPENITYGAPMKAYYPATFGFDSINELSSWSDSSGTGCETAISGEFDGHNDFLTLSDASASGQAKINQGFSSQTSGTVEMWVRKSSQSVDGDDNSPLYVTLTDSSSTLGPFIRIDANNDAVFSYHDGSYHSITTFFDDAWYHLRFDFDCTSDTYDLYINDQNELTGASFWNGNDLSSIAELSFYTETSSKCACYIDAVGYSWDSNYAIGDNLKEGLLIDFESSRSLTSRTYSLDGGAAVSIVGDKTIKLPSNGVHSIRVSGNIGTYNSELRYFSVYSDIGIRTPENTTIVDRSTGYYPGSYSFDEVPEGQEPAGGYYFQQSSSTSVTVMSELEEHKSVIHMYDKNIASGARVIYRYDFSNQITGEIEFWYYPDNDMNSYINIHDSSSDRINLFFNAATDQLSYETTSGSYSNILAYTETWYHIRIEFDCSGDDWSLWVDEVSYLDQVNFIDNALITNLDCISFDTSDSLTTYAAGDVYYDALGFSWDSNYQIGANTLYGLLLDIESPYDLVWMGYSLNGQSNITILGDTTILAPPNGQYSLQVFGNISIGTMYQSLVKYFEIDMRIRLNTPLNRTYIEPIRGYYPAMYGFEGDELRDDPPDWTDSTGAGCSTRLIYEMDGHHNVYELSDWSNPNYCNVQQQFGTQSYGTVEFWIRTDDASKESSVIFYSGGTSILGILIDNDKFRYYDGTNHDIYLSPVDNTWYHIRIDFEGTSGGYQGLAQWKWKANINGTTYGSYDYRLTNNLDNLRLMTNTVDTGYITYIDSVDYSWATDYQSGRNKNEGLLIDTDAPNEFAWRGYSLNGQTNISMLTDIMTINLPKNGIHSLQVYGTDSLGRLYKSDIVYFTLDYDPLNIDSPQSITYSSPMSGHYPATYGFENDIMGKNPRGWEVHESGNTNVEIVNEDGHNNVISFTDDSPSLFPYIINDFSSPVVNEVIEFWYKFKSSSIDDEYHIQLYDSLNLRVWVSLRNDSMRLYSNGGAFQDYLSINGFQWHHFRISFNAVTDTYTISLDDEFVDTKTFYSNSVDINRIQISSTANGISNFFVDAIGYSWDPNYEVGYNLNEGLLLNYTNDCNFEWMGYSLNGQTNISISGNTTIPFPKNALNTIQVSGMKSSGVSYKSELVYFSTDISLTINNPTNTTHTEPTRGYFTASFGFENEYSDKTGLDLIFVDEMSSSMDECDVRVIDELDGHKKILKNDDTSGGDNAWFYHYFDNDYLSGMIEFWFRTEDVTTTNRLYLTEDQTVRLNSSIQDGKFRYHDGSTDDWVLDCEPDRWYHLKYVFYSDDTCDWYIDGKKVINRGNLFSGMASGMNRFYIKTINTITYLDAFGFSWDPDYTEWQNCDEGLYLDYDFPFKVDWAGYSVDNKNNMTIFKNSTIPFPENGIHSLKLFANNSFGVMYESSIRYFTFDYHPLSLNSPGNITYNTMNGYYVGTYGFDNDTIGEVPFGWTDRSEGNGFARVDSEFYDHQKILRVFSQASGANKGQAYCNFATQTSGTVEFWWASDDATSNATISLRDGSTNRILFGIYNRQFRVYNSTWYTIKTGIADYTWYHIQINFNCATDLYDVSIDGQLCAINVDFTSNSVTLDNIYVLSNDVYFSTFIDAVAFSWDSHYSIGDNRYEGIFIDIASDIKLVWTAYSLDNSPNETIIGDTAIPLVTNDVYELKLSGNNSIGLMYEVSVVFTLNTEAPMITPYNFTNGSYVVAAKYLRFNIYDANLDEDSVNYSLNQGVTNVTSWQSPYLIPVSSTDSLQRIDIWAKDLTGHSAHAIIIVGLNSAYPNLQTNTTIGKELEYLPLNITFVASDANLSRVDLLVYDPYSMKVLDQQTRTIGVDLVNNSLNHLVINELNADTKYKIRLVATDTLGAETEIIWDFTTNVGRIFLVKGKNVIRWTDSEDFLRMELELEIENDTGQLLIGWQDNKPEPKERAIKYFQLDLLLTEMKSCRVTFYFTDTELEQKNLLKEYLAAFKYNDKEKEWEELEFEIDLTKNSITFEIDSFSEFVVAQNQPWFMDPFFWVIIFGIVTVGLITVVIVRRKLKDPARMYGKLKYKDKDKEDIDFDNLDIDYDKLDLSDELDLKSFFRKDEESFDD